MSFVKWDECPHCDGAGEMCEVYKSNNLDMERYVQCKACLLHSQLAEKDKEIARLTAEMNCFAMCGGLKGAQAENALAVIVARAKALADGGGE